MECHGCSTLGALTKLWRFSEVIVRCGSYLVAGQLGIVDLVQPHARGALEDLGVLRKNCREHANPMLHVALLYAS